MYEGQQTVQIVILLVAFMAVPVLLIAKPFILSRRQKKSHGDEGMPLGAVGSIVVLRLCVCLPAVHACACVFVPTCLHRSL